jgi:hypothetical protein
MKFLLARCVGALWWINLVALFGFVAWIVCDGSLHFAAESLGASLLNWQSPPFAGRLLLLAMLAISAISTLLGIFIGLFIGPPAYRRIRSWLAFTLLCAAWLTLAVTWRELAWRGQILRVHQLVEAFEPIAASLRADWPSEDGQRPGIGPFMGYPIGRPTMLMLLTMPRAPGTSVDIASIERSSSGALRFLLAGSEPGVWLEWHPPQSKPISFIGGLMGEFDLRRVASIGDGWYLVRYNESASPIVLAPPASNQ